VQDIVDFLVAESRVRLFGGIDRRHRRQRGVDENPANQFAVPDA
jgi:hypothetical protein